jgi:hypothetical protein
VLKNLVMVLVFPTNGVKEEMVSFAAFSIYWLKSHAGFRSLSSTGWSKNGAICAGRFPVDALCWRWGVCGVLGIWGRWPWLMLFELWLYFYFCCTGACT